MTSIQLSVSVLALAKANNLIELFAELGTSL